MVKFVFKEAKRKFFFATENDFLGQTNGPGTGTELNGVVTSLVVSL